MARDAFGNYSRSLRCGNTVHRVFFGKGPAAQFAAALDNQRRADRQSQAVVWAVREAARAPAEASLHALDELTDRMMRATLLAAGYHRHDRGSWRRRRMNANGSTNGACMDNAILDVEGTCHPPAAERNRAAEPSPINPSDPSVAFLSAGDLRDLLGRAEQGDRTVLPALRRLLDIRPELWQHCGNLARVAEADWIDLIAGHSLLMRESLTRKVAALKGELAGPDAPPLERLLTERVACCWMQANHADSVVANLKGEARSIAQLDLLQRRQERTQRSYLAAIKALATVRRLGVAAPPAAPAEVGGAEQVKPRRGVKSRERSREDATLASHRPTPDRPIRTDSPKAGKVKAASRKEVVPKVLRDRLKGLVGSDN